MGSLELVLVHVKADGSTAELPIRKTETLFGRHSDCQVKIPSGQVSRRHCQLTLDGEQAMLTDLGSSNGTFVNGRKIEETVALAAGDLLAIGDIVFVARINNQPSSIDAVIAYGEGLPTRSEHEAVPVSGPDEPTSDGGLGRLAPIGTQLDDSSVVEFDFDFEDDDDQQPPL